MLSPAFSRYLTIVIALFMLLVQACSNLSEFRGDSAPRFSPPFTDAPRPRVALVLGTGGPRGFAHIGVIKILEANRIEPDLVVGASVGAMIGALYASGYRAAQLERLALELNVIDLFDIDPFSRGKARGFLLQRFINERVANRPMERLKRAFAATATRKADGRLSIFNSGNTGVAVRASSSNPYGFLPVTIEGQEFIDGDEASPVPIRAARVLGAQVVIAVDVSAYAESTPPEANPHWIARDLKRKRLVEAEADQADVLIHPDLGYYAPIHIDYRKRCIARGEAATLQALPHILAAIAGKAKASPIAQARHAE